MSVANQIVQHPYYNNTLKVASTTVGRDKLYRTVQYFARFAAFYAYRKGYSKEVIESFATLKTALGNGRKLMRIGKPLEHFQASVRAVTLGDPIVRATTIGRQLGYAFFLLFDNLSWLQFAKVTKFSPETADKINKNAMRAWVIGIAFSIVNGLYRLHEIRGKSAVAKNPQASPEKEAERKVEVKTLEKQSYAVKYQLLQDLLDILIPASSLKLVNADEGIVGLAGMITSIQGLKTQTEKVLGK